MPQYPRTVAVLAALALAVPLAYGAPTITQISPDHGPSRGGTNVIIVGMGFDESGTTQVLFDGEPATDVVVFPGGAYYAGDETMIGCTTPRGNEGPTDVTVINPDLTSFTLPSSYFYDGPVVTGVSPNFGSTCGGTEVTITGINFDPVGHTSVSFAAHPATHVTVAPDGNSITCVTPAVGAENAGTICIFVQNPNLEGATNWCTFNYIVCDESGSVPVESSADGNQVTEGEEATLQVAPPGSIRSIHWRKAPGGSKNGEPEWEFLEDGGNISGSNTTQLVIDPVTAADAGLYSAVYEDMAGNAYSTASFALGVEPAAFPGTPAVSNLNYVYMACLLVALGILVLVSKQRKRPSE